MMYYIRNKSANQFVDEFTGIVVPAKIGTDEGVFGLDANDLQGLLRQDSQLQTLFNTGTVTSGGNAFLYETDLYVSTDGTAGELKADVVPASIVDATARRVYAYKTILRELAANIQYNGVDSNFLQTESDVQAAIDALDAKLAELSGVSETLQWRPAALAITEDPALNVAGPVAISGLGNTFSDDDLPGNFDIQTDLPDGKFILYKGTTPADDKLWKSDGTNLVLQTADEGLNPGYTFIVKNDLTNSPDEREKEALYTYTTLSGLIRIGDANWNDMSLQDAYTGGNSIELSAGRPILITSSGGDPRLAIDDTDILLKDSYLTAGLNLSEATQAGLGVDQWQVAHEAGTKANGVYDWSRPNSPELPASIVGALNALRDDVNEAVTLLNTSPTATDVDANGSNLIGVKGLPGVLPAGGLAEGDNGSLQAMLEGLVEKIAASGGKTFVDQAAFEAAKAAGTTFNAGEVVFIQDVNRFVEVITTTTAIVEGVDYVYVGSTGNALLGASYEINSDLVKLANILTVQKDVEGYNKVSVDNSGIPTLFNFPESANADVFNAGSSSLVDGDTYYDTSLKTLMVYNAATAKWISTEKNLFQYGATTANGQYLSINGVQAASTGFLIARDSVLTRVAIVIADGNLTKAFEIRVNGVLAGSVINPVAGKAILDLDIAVTEGDLIQVFAAAAGQPARNVVATVESAYRR